MKQQNFNLLNKDTLTQLGFDSKELAHIDEMRPLPNIFHLVQLDTITPERIGDLLKQGICVGASDAAFVPDRNMTVISPEDLAQSEVDCICADEDGEMPALVDGFSPENGILTDPFGIFEPFNPKKLIKINECDQFREVLLSGLGFERQVVDLNGLNPREEFQRINRRVEFATRFARLKARAALTKSILRIVENARKICTNPHCPDPSITFGQRTVDEVFSLALPAVNPDGTPRANVFVFLVLYLARQSLFIACTKRD